MTRLQEHKTEWSAVGGVVMAVFGGGAIAWDVAASAPKSGLATWPVVAFAAAAIAGACLMLAPLLSLRPWHDEAKPSGLEEWLRKRLEAASALARQRSLRGDGWFFKEMQEWDAENAGQLLTVAPDLVDQYRARPENLEEVDGVPPPHGASEQESYYARRRAWLEATLRGLSKPSAATSPDTKPRSAADELGMLRERGLAIRRELAPPKGYATPPISVLGQLMPALPEQRVRAWAVTVRAYLENRAPRFLANFDIEPDLPAPHLFANLVSTVKTPELLVFLDRKLSALQAIITELNRGH